MVSSELVVLLIVCVWINTGSAQDPGELYCSIHNLSNCEDQKILSIGPCENSKFKCNLYAQSDTSFICVSTTLDCMTNNNCTAEINYFTRDCQFIIIGANVLLPIYCCLCYTDNNILWDCSITSSPLPSGNNIL